MKKFTTIKTLLVGLCAMGAMSAWAADPDLENDYTLVKSVSWGGADAVNIAGSGACAYTAWDTGNKKQQALTILTAPEDAAGWIAMQAWTPDNQGKGWWNRSGNSLYCVNAGRSAAVFGDDLTTGWLVVFECTQKASNVMSVTRINGDNNPDGTFTYALSEDEKTYFCTITAAENAYVGFCGNKNVQGILKISVYKPNQAVVMSKYTVKYVDMDGKTLKDDVEYDAVGGASVSITGADKANITKDDVTYIYDNDDSEGAVVAEDGSTVVTVKFHAAANFSYTVNEICDGEIVRATEGTSYETATVKVPYRKYNVKDGVLYSKGDTGKEYNYSFSLTEDNLVKSIEYTASTTMTNVVFLSEGEDIEGLTPCNSNNTGIRSSNSASAYASSDTKITTLEPGKYKLHAVIYDASKTPDSHWIFKAGDRQIADLNCTTVNIQELASPEFEVYYETDIIMAKMGGNTMGLDAIYIEKTGDVELPENVTVTVTDAGYATYCSEYALDLSGVEAYTATIDGNQVSFVAQNGVVAPGTGLLIKAEAGDVTIPVAAEGAETIADNVLISGTTAPAGSFVLMGSPAVGFYKTTADFTLGANTAYIAPVASEAREFIALGEATAIKAIETAKQSNEIYNLAGQRVKSAQKGLFIIGGKKVIK